ncbi:MAG: DNA polymerase III subunit alpha [Gammaproteobacteria bacterium]|nr:DNA polymerase III subunit alpha [Gammaproteobacteria bacterium]
MQPSFIHLHLHTEFSLVDGAIRIKSLMQACAENGMPAVALTDQSNMFATIKFYRAARAAGVKPIIGLDVLVQPREKNEKPTKLILLAQNHIGYINLSELISKAYLQGQHSGQPLVEVDWVKQHAEGVIALSGARDGEIGKAILAGNLALAGQLLDEWRAVYGDRFYIELQRTGRPNEQAYIEAALVLAGETQTPVVATNDVRFLKQDDFDSHEIRVCISSGRTLDDPRREKDYSDQQYLRSPQEMSELFSDIPEALANSVEIAKRCSMEIRLGESFLPDFPIPEGETTDSYFRLVAFDGLEKRLDVLLDKSAADYTAQRQVYIDRLEFELKTIIDMGFPGYFLIVADFIKWAKENDVPVGPGRGSGAGSLVAYAMLITDLDPLEYDLLFERFLNPERVSLPDFDIDFCMDGRDRVIDYVARTYGRDRVSQIITYGTMAAKAVVRDVGRVLGHAYGFVDRISKAVPFEIGMTLSKALVESDELKSAYDDDEEVRALIDIALSLEGLARNAGKHAGGVVISPSVLTDFAPVYCEHGATSIVTQFDKDDVEAAGLVKFDFLGLRTLTIIDWAVKNINVDKIKAGEEPLQIEFIDLADAETFTQLKLSNTTAVFQLESSGMKDLIKRLQPDCFEDIIALVALFRPGPLGSGMVDDFINRKHGRADVAYPHPDLEPVLEPTYGVILYQEQVMQIAQVLANYTLGGADMLRRAMGKKKPEVMAEQRLIFEQGAAERNIDQKTASGIFDLMEYFSGYGFNKSHSAAYALLSYQTMWLKTHYPSEFMAAVLSADMDNTDKVVTLIEDCHSMGLEVLPPNVNSSEIKFSVNANKAIVYGLGAIKGVGEAALESVIEERRQTGPYKDIYEFCRRVDSRKVNKRVMEGLIRSGAMDDLGAHRATLMARLPEASQMADQHQKNFEQGQDDLFGSAADEDLNMAPISQTNVAEWDDEQRLRAEKETLGLYLTGHPIERYEEELRKFTQCSFIKLHDIIEAPTDGYRARKNNTVYCLAGLMVDVRARKTKAGKKIVSAVLDDRTARIEVQIYEEVYEEYAYLINKDKLMVVEGPVIYDEYFGGHRITAQKIYDIESARERFAKRVDIKLDSARAANGFMNGLAATLKPFTEGNFPVWVHYRTPEAIATLELDKNWNVTPTDELISRLRNLVDEESVKILY